MNRTQNWLENGARRRNAVAGLLLSLFLFVLAMAQYEALHRYFHPDACQPEHQCAVTMLQAGQIESTTAHVGVVSLPAVLVTFTLPQTVAVAAADFTLLPGRAPPAFLS
ncbi:MAG TPA: hypothetical protein PKA41_05215 [Verrucomicrobiota bacterium]|nr:hypothetical protein [Verrucomicrobiota bacterium]